LALLGVVGSFIWFALAWYGLSTLRDIRDTVDHADPNNE
jgi:hypothetical protein